MVRFGVLSVAGLLVGTASSVSVHAEIVGVDDWLNTGATLSWNVTNPDNDAWWTYEYCWSGNETLPGISHLIIEVTPGADESEFRNFMAKTNPGDDYSETDAVEVKEFTTGTSNPGMPEKMWGIKFNGDTFFGEDTVCIKFDTMRAPVPGDFLANGGSESGAYNDGFTVNDTDPLTGVGVTGTLPDVSQDPQHILRPDGFVPEPSSLALCTMGAALALLAYARRKRRWR
jgi:hypothetical protein